VSRATDWVRCPVIRPRPVPAQWGLSIKEKHRSSVFFASMHDHELLLRSLQQEIMLIVAHAATFSRSASSLQHAIAEDSQICQVVLLCFSPKLDLCASASVAKSLFHWLRGRFMMLKRMLRIQFL